MLTPNEALRAVEREEVTADEAATELLEYRNFREETKTGPAALMRDIEAALDKLAAATDADLRQEG